MATGNLLLSAAILLCGLTFTGIAYLADVVMLSERRFYDLQRDYVYPIVHTTYIRQQEAIVEYLRKNRLHQSGDGHSDSSGYSAKYAIYSLMDSATDLILDYRLVHVSETGVAL